MKGIKLCAECADYNWKKHKCNRGSSVETNARDPFYDDCPLPEVVEVVRCKDCKYYHGANFGCGVLNLYPKPDWFCADGVKKE